MRLFAALELPDHVRQALIDWWADACAYLDSDAWRRVPPHQWHLTLAFFGDVTGHDAEDLAEALLACASESPFVSLKTGGCGLFPRPQRPRVFWAGVDDQGDAGDLKHLARCCRRAGHATVRGRRASEAAFRGHVTLARSGIHVRAMDGEKLNLMLPVPQIHWRAERLCLFQSILRPEGAQYRRLETFELGKDARARGNYVR